MADGTMEHRPEKLALVAILLLAACDSRAPSPDAGMDARVPGLDGGAEDAGSGDAGSDAGSSDAGPIDAGSSDAGPSDAGPSDAGSIDAGSIDAGPPDAGSIDAGPPDAGGPLTYDVRVLADGFCDMLSFDPPSISVPAGTEFTVRWINATGCTDVDIDKSGTVPIVLGLAPGDAYHDTIRRWCGIFTGTFSFRAYYSPTYVFTLPVDCDG